MRSFNLNVLLLATLGWFSVAVPTFALAQDVFYFGDSLHEIPVSELQDEKLSAAQDKFQEEIERLRGTFRTTQNNLRQQVFERDTEVEQLLSADQLKSLNEKRMAETRENAKANVKFMTKFSELLEHLAASGDLSMYEGLPRASDDELAKLKHENEAIEIDGWSFYKQPLPTRPSVVEKLRSTLADYRSFEPYTGRKFCGGFHPDFCVEWETEGKTFRILICLTCFESVFISPNGKTTFDFNDAAWKSFVQVAISTFTKHKIVIEKLDEMLGQ